MRSRAIVLIHQILNHSNWQGPKQRSLVISARVPFATFRSNLSSGLVYCWVHSHTGFESVTSSTKVSCNVFAHCWCVSLSLSYHIKWRFQFPSFLSILRVSDWLIVGFILIGRQQPTFSSVVFYSVCLHQKKFHSCPCSHLYIRRFDFKFQNGMLGMHSYGKSPVTSSNKSYSAF
jgi:hypothetical protein